ncbi:pantoate--beta-alanine ligase [Rhodoligotrophos appendicifer]|uniref:pantoate--beta-alanine ligase n=1 Tax=Rhodoligotrophos appendicifer TaxID=987056 RepID=UPI0011858B49|nr:pantoate--beta-alanine ligase [Rhodoligotrophos appendicifer]
MQMVEVVRSISALRGRTREWHRKGETVALVPTMGALHAGHLSLIAKARELADHVAVTIFVNPTQFSATEDFGSYPRGEAADLAAVAKTQAELVYAPDQREMYPPRFATTITVGGPAVQGLEDHVRPHFFGGVATVVAKLLSQSQCDVAVFGEKDYQQLLVIRQMASDLDIPCRVVGAETLREADGLAMSSRNAYLSAAERKLASQLYQQLQATAADISTGAVLASLEAGKKSLQAAGFEVDYLELRDAETLATDPSPEIPRRLLVAARLGKTRLIDNIAV